MSPRVTRRGLVGGAAASAAAHLVPAAASAATTPFHGTHQAGIATPRQRHLTAAAFTVTASDRAGLRNLMRAWTQAAARMTAGHPAAVGDSGEARGLPASALTITFGFGDTLFVRDGADRFGLAAHRPAALDPIPPLRGDELDPARGGGDLYVQVCADDQQVAFHALRTLTAAGRGAAAIAWRQNGFRSDPANIATPRNLQGFKDGTNNIGATDRRALRTHVWVPSEPKWMRGGSFLIMRRIRMLLEAWDAIGLRRQELAVGRHKRSGAPLGAEHEHDRVSLSRLDAQGRQVIPLGAHIRHAAPSLNGGVRILRRGYSYDDGVDPATGTLDAGLFFLAFQRSPQRQGIRLLEQLATYDRLNEFTRHVASGVYACPGGARRGSYVGAALLG